MKIWGFQFWIDLGLLYKVRKLQKLTEYPIWVMALHLTGFDSTP